MHVLWVSQFPDTPMWTIANTHGNRLILGAGTPPISATPRNSRPTKMKYHENLVECIGAIRELEARMRSVVACFTIDSWYMFSPISGCQRSYITWFSSAVWFWLDKTGVDFDWLKPLCWFDMGFIPNLLGFWLSNPNSSIWQSPINLSQVLPKCSLSLRQFPVYWLNHIIFSRVSWKRLKLLRNGLGCCFPVIWLHGPNLKAIWYSKTS